MKKFLIILKRIIKVILIAFLILFIIGLAVTKFNCGTNTASADSNDSNIQPRNTIYPTYDFEGNIDKYRYINVTSTNTQANYNLLVLGVDNFPNYPVTTVEIIINSISNEDTYFVVWYVPIIKQGNTEAGEYFTINTSDTNTFRIALRYEGTLEVSYNIDIYFYAGEYTPGYAQGLQAGLQQGKAEGAELAQYGIFQGATIDGAFLYKDANSDSEELNINKTGLIPDYISNGINTRNLWAQFADYTENNKEYYLQTADITINLKSPFVYSNDRPILLGGPSVSLVDSIILTDINDKKYYATIEYRPGTYNPSILSEDDLRKIGLVKSIFVGFGRAYDTFYDVTILQDNGNYTGGYTAGYNNGLSDGRLEGEETGYNNGYNKGLTEGEANGYAKAVSEGVSQEGIFYGAIAFTKVFFQLSTVFLSTPLVGDITLGLLVIGLPCAFMLINLGIGLAKKWLGGRGASEGED